MASWFSSFQLESLTAQVTAAAAAAQESVSKLSNDLQENVKSLTDNLILMDISTLTQDVQSKVLAVGSDIRNEEQQRIAEKDLVEKRTIKLLPWESYDSIANAETKIFDADLMQKVFGLSLNPLNFTQDPEFEFEFELAPHINCAMRLMKLDANLSKMHSRYIVKIDEYRFWRNYFYQVSMLRNVAGLEPLIQCTQRHATAKEFEMPSSDQVSTSSVQVKDTVAPIDTTSSKANPEVSKLQAEAPKDNVSRSDSFDDLHDFDDLGDLNEFDNSEDDKELEARIAAEIENI